MYTSWYLFAILSEGPSKSHVFCSQTTFSEGQMWMVQRFGVLVHKGVHPANAKLVQEVDVR